MSFAREIGKLIANLRNPRWVSAQSAKLGATIGVTAPAGKRVTAYLRGHLHHDGGHVADHYQDDNDNDYVYHNGQAYYYDSRSDTWYRV